MLPFYRPFSLDTRRPLRGPRGHCLYTRTQTAQPHRFRDTIEQHQPDCAPANETIYSPISAIVHVHSLQQSSPLSASHAPRPLVPRRTLAHTDSVARARRTRLAAVALVHSRSLLGHINKQRLTSFRVALSRRDTCARTRARTHNNQQHSHQARERATHRPRDAAAQVRVVRAGV